MVNSWKVGLATKDGGAVAVQVVDNLHNEKVKFRLNPDDPEHAKVIGVVDVESGVTVHAFPLEATLTHEDTFVLTINVTV